MLCKRIIATVLLRNGLIVQSKQFKHTNIIGNAITAIDFFNTWGADEIVILDVSHENNRKDFLNIIEEFGTKCNTPLTVGGYNRTRQDIRDCLNAGADKITINRIVKEKPEIITEFAEIFGSQCIVVSIDYRDNENPLERIMEAEKMGAGEIYLTSIDRDGMQSGYDLKIIKKASKSVNIPIIASGGCGTWEHCKEAFHAGADAVSIANRLHYSEHSIKEAKEYLLKAGFHIRPPEFVEF